MTPALCTEAAADPACSPSGGGRMRPAGEKCCSVLLRIQSRLPRPRSRGAMACSSSGFPHSCPSSFGLAKVAEEMPASAASRCVSSECSGVTARKGLATCGRGALPGGLGEGGCGCLGREIGTGRGSGGPSFSSHHLCLEMKGTPSLDVCRLHQIPSHSRPRAQHTMHLRGRGVNQLMVGFKKIASGQGLEGGTVPARHHPPTSQHLIGAFILSIITCVPHCHGSGCSDSKLAKAQVCLNSFPLVPIMIQTKKRKRSLMPDAFRAALTNRGSLHLSL